jgi:imidazolonepropionase-like amidohydrolase
MLKLVRKSLQPISIPDFVHASLPLCFLSSPFAGPSLKLDRRLSRTKKSTSHFLIDNFRVLFSPGTKLIAPKQLVTCASLWTNAGPSVEAHRKKAQSTSSLGQRISTSNRHIPELESLVTYRKKTIGLRSNRHKFTFLHFRHFSPSLLPSLSSRRDDPERGRGVCLFASSVLLLCLVFSPIAFAQSQSSSEPIILHAAHLLDMESGKIISPGEILVQGERIAEVGSSVSHPAGAQTIELGDTTLMPGLIDSHVHLFLHPGNETLQTVEESVPQRTIQATLAARADLMAGYTAERDMGTEGAGSADTAVRNAINSGEIPGPRLRITGNAISILGGHEDALGFNPAQHVLPNATYANNSDELIEVIREQLKEGANLIKIYETGRDTFRNGQFVTPYQYTEAQLAAAVQEAARMHTYVTVHCTGEPGALYAAEAGVVSIEHAFQLSDETMRLMREKDIPADPTFTISEYFADHAATPAAAAMERRVLDYHVEQFHKQLAAGVPMVVGSDVGPFPHGTQAREYVLMVKYGMTPLAALQAGLLNGAKLLGWQGQIGALKPGYYADIIAVPGNPLQDISVLEKVSFVMKGGVIYRK